MGGWAGVPAAGLAEPCTCGAAAVVVMLALRVAGGMTVVRSWVTRLAVAVAAGRVVGITVKVAASPFLLMSGGNTWYTPDGVARAFWSLTSRGSVPRSSPPA